MIDMKTKLKRAGKVKMAMAVFIIIAAALLTGCIASGKNLEPSQYFDGDFDSSGLIRLTTDQSSYPKGTNTISYTVTNSSNREVYYGVSYSVEMKLRGAWHQLPFKDSTAWIAIAYKLESGESQSYQADLSLLRFSLSQGEYRLVKQVGEKLYSAEFAIGE
ncbi:MAG: immunoglobulin-like domain-containing protein [Christensenellales bacterium]|jgi:hypothetical protein